MQLARAHAIALYMDLVMTYCHNPERWAAAKSTVLAAGRLALPYCLKELRGWVSRGGMALGAHPPLCLHGVLRLETLPAYSEKTCERLWYCLQCWWLVRTALGLYVSNT